LYKDCVAQGT
jgi:hypothetical protein